MTNKRKIIILIAAAFAAAFFSHFFFLREWWNDSYMLGPNDGLNQIAPFKALLYNEYTSGHFFYSFSFGMGAGIYSQLGYYYSTNLVYLFSVAVVFLLDTIGIIDSPDALFWAQANVWISVIRVTVIILITTAVFRYMKIQTVPAFVGASLYAISAIYFRHVIFWEFFADALLWVPLLVLGVEKIIREKQPAWFVIAIALTVFSNFYFAYINLIFIGIYILARWLIRLEKNEAPLKKQFKHYTLGGILGFGMGSPGFIPAAYGYFNNHRPPYEDSIPLWDFSDNILFTSLTLLLPTIFVLFVWIGTFYKNKLFLLFASISLLLIILHFSPLAGSLFNGFSAPRNRFEYLASFTIGGMTALGLQLLTKVKRTWLFTAGILALIMYIVMYVTGDVADNDTNQGLLVLIQAFVTALVFVLFGWFRKPALGYTLLAVIMIGNILVLNNHQRIEFHEGNNVDQVTREYMLSEDYMNEEQMNLIDRLQAQDETTMPRLDWRGEDTRNNIPLVQEFYGTSAYSSIQNQNMLFLYYEDLEIDMESESVSRYSGFGDRANLYSDLRGKYLMHAKEEEEVVPYGFEEFMESDNYVIYENTNVLPFVQTSSTIYDREDALNRSIPEREQAMLSGIILEDTGESAEIPDNSPDILEEAEIMPVNGEYSDGQLTVTEEEGGLDIVLGEESESWEDLYVSFYLENNDRDAPGFLLDVNEFRTDRKSHNSLYRTDVNNITIRVESTDTISIRIPEGSYTLDNLALAGETYETLEQAAASETHEDEEVTIKGNRMELEFNNSENDTHLTLPVPYERGWDVKVNGEAKDVLETNFAFLGTEIEPGDNTIEFVYYPPFFRFTFVVSVIAFIVTALWGIYKWKQKKNSKEPFRY